MKTVYPYDEVLSGYDFPPDHVFVQWRDVGYCPMGSGTTTGGKIHPVTGEVWIQKVEAYRMRYEVYSSAEEYRGAVKTYRENVERDPEKSI